MYFFSTSTTLIYILINNIINLGGIKMEKIVIDKNKCIGCGLCVHNHPEYLIFDEMGLAETVDKEIPENDKSSFLKTVEQCPTEAFKIEDIKTSEDNIAA